MFGCHLKVFGCMGLFRKGHEMVSGITRTPKTFDTVQLNGSVGSKLRKTDEGQLLSKRNSLISCRLMVKFAKINTVEISVIFFYP